MEETDNLNAEKLGMKDLCVLKCSRYYFESIYITLEIFNRKNSITKFTYEEKE